MSLEDPDLSYLHRLYSSGGISGAVGLPGESIANLPSAWTSCTKILHKSYIRYWNSSELADGKLLVGHE